LDGAQVDSNAPLQVRIKKIPYQIDAGSPAARVSGQGKRVRLK
jgi:hypothetical protein